ncbi:hypothetical protein KM043_012071 [Ampulex compressa]|nr:hypothetical protein KM043_012071 [Ampulex compressa]
MVQIPLPHRDKDISVLRSTLPTSVHEEFPALSYVYRSSCEKIRQGGRRRVREKFTSSKDKHRMVSSTVTENGKTSPPRKTCCATGVPSGNYRLVGWDMDATGKKFVDEICQIACFTPSSSYSQYVMPYKDLNPPAIKRHSMRVVTMGKFRVLKDSKTNKVLKTKSMVSALTEFLAWLEFVKGDATDGVILVYHEPRKVIPAMLLESLMKYNLLERFKETVKGFANGFNVAEVKCANTTESFTLRMLSRSLLKKQQRLDNAKDRAYLALQIIQHLSSMETPKTSEETGSGDSDAAMKNTIEYIKDFVQPVHVEEKEHAELKVIYERQNSLRPIFGALFRVNRRERQHASPLRRLLAEAGIEYVQLQEAWASGKKEGLEKLIKEKLSTAEKKELEDLLVVLEGYFDPEKKSKSMTVHEKKEIKTESSKFNDDKENNNKCDSGTESPDTTISHTPVKMKQELPENTLVAVEE